jgi:general secretion pathway protein G
MIRTSKNGGFTLVEITIVILILGILAAIIIPKFSDATDVSRLSNLQTQLHSLRGQIELARLQHQGTYPTLTSWSQLTATTEPTSAYTAGDGTEDVGPYLQQPPVNPFESSSTVAAAPAAGVGWTYNASTGAIKAVMSATKAAALNVDTLTEDIAKY